MSNQLPQALLTTPMASVSTMNIETSVLDPIVINQQFCRFVLERKGILDTGSAISFAVQTQGARGFLPLKTGIHSLVKRAVLRIGSKVVAISDEYPHYQTIRRQFKTSEEKCQKDMVKVGSVDVCCPSNAQDGTYQVRDVDYNAAGTTALIPPEILLTAAELGPIFSIRISELFPMMRSVQLPLFLINEPCSIELTFNQQLTAASVGSICCIPTGQAENNCSVNLQSVKFLADYLTYDDERMDETAKLVMSDQGMTIPYEDVITTIADYQALGTTPTGTAVVQQNFVRDLGLSNMNVRSIISSMSSQQTNASNVLLGKYKSEAFNVPDSLQVRINDRQHFPRPVTSESQKEYQLSQVFSTDLSILNAEYSLDMSVAKTGKNDITNQMLTTSTLEGHAQTTLTGCQHYEGVDLSVGLSNAPGSGVQIGQKPVQVLQTLNRTADTNDDRKVRFFSLVERTMNIRQGMVQVSA
tara:strand:+ start:3797 stop:5206 length:1410 start_codon:yes stop_codon:yes gene_type:complete